LLICLGPPEHADDKIVSATAQQSRNQITGDKIAGATFGAACKETKV
jgi:hypothetical protein